MGMRGSMMTCKILLGGCRRAPRVCHRMDLVVSVNKKGGGCQPFIVFLMFHASISTSSLCGCDIFELGCR